MIQESKCSKRSCRHYIGVIQPDGTEFSEVHSCAAFPDGIPDDIVDGNNLHSDIISGQIRPYIYDYINK